MRILVTVGTTSFDTLMRHCDESLKGYDLRFQIAGGRYHPKNGSYLRFGDIAPLYAWADLVITHAGAGSVYTLLEQGKRLIVVPNLERRDPHQQELARYIEVNRFAHVLWEPSAIREAIEVANQSMFEPYVPYRFCMSEEITSLLLANFTR